LFRNLQFSQPSSSSGGRNGFVSQFSLFSGRLFLGHP